MKLAIEIIGWTGAALILGAYALLSAGKLRAETLTYHVMNILGAAGFVINSGWNGALPSAAMNVVCDRHRGVRGGPAAQAPPGHLAQAHPPWPPTVAPLRVCPSAPSGDAFECQSCPYARRLAGPCLAPRSWGLRSP